MDTTQTEYLVARAMQVLLQANGKRPTWTVKDARAVLALLNELKVLREVTSGKPE